MIVDLHNHTSKYSQCSIISPKKLIEIYIKNNIQGICITEHNIFWNENEKNRLKGEYSNRIKIFFGIEIDTDIGHILMFSKENKQIKIKPFISIFSLFSIIDKKNTTIIWAHPFRWDRKQVESKITDEIILNFNAVELLNGNCNSEIINFTENFFRKFNIKFTGGSDTHSVEMACKYGTKFNKDVNSQNEFVDLLINGEYYPVIF